MQSLLSDIGIDHGACFLTVMDCAIVLMANLCLLSLNLVRIISLIRYSLIRTLCSHNGCKHAFGLI